MSVCHSSNKIGGSKVLHIWKRLIQATMVVRPKIMYYHGHCIIYSIKINGRDSKKIKSVVQRSSTYENDWSKQPWWSDQKSCITMVAPLFIWSNWTVEILKKANRWFEDPPHMKTIDPSNHGGRTKNHALPWLLHFDQNQRLRFRKCNLR